MKDADVKLLQGFFKEIQEKTEYKLHKRILEAAITEEKDFLKAMEQELGKYLLEVLNHEN